MRTCKRCNETKSEAGFYAQPKASDGLMGVCKECHKAAVTLRRRTNPAVQEYDRRRYYEHPHRKALTEKVARLWNEKNPEGYRAHYAVSNAVRDRRLFKGPCEVCGATIGIHAHHDDYTKPLDVRWLCVTHHQLHHAEERR